MFPSSSTLQFFPRVSATAFAAADTVNIFQDVTFASLDAKGEVAPPLPVWHYIIVHDL